MHTTPHTRWLVVVVLIMGCMMYISLKGHLWALTTTTYSMLIRRAQEVSSGLYRAFGTYILVLSPMVARARAIGLAAGLWGSDLGSQKPYFGLFLLGRSSPAAATVPC